MKMDCRRRVKITYKGRNVGVIVGDTFETIRKPEHYMRKYQGFGISEKVLMYLERVRIEKIRIIYEGKRGRKVYNPTVTQFKHSKLVQVDGVDDRQFFVPEKELEPQQLY